MIFESQKPKLSLQNAAAFLNVSHTFVIDEIEAGRLACRLVDGRRSIEFEELERYQSEQKQRSADALKRLCQLSREIGEEL